MDVKFEKRDVVQCENLIRALKKAKFDLDGMEVLAFAEVMRWVNALYNRIQAESQLVEAPKKPSIASAKEVKSPIADAPKSAKAPKKSKN